MRAGTVRGVVRWAVVFPPGVVLVGVPTVTAVVAVPVVIAVVAIGDIRVRRHRVRGCQQEESSEQCSESFLHTTLTPDSAHNGHKSCLSRSSGGRGLCGRATWCPRPVGRG